MRRMSQPFVVTLQRRADATKCVAVVVEEENENDAAAATTPEKADAKIASTQNQNQVNSRLQDKLKRQARTHALLVSIVVVFALSWFPLNVLNLILDIHDIFQVRFLRIFICYS